MNVIKKVRHCLLLQRLKQSKIPLKLWHNTIAKMPLMQQYHSRERMKIRLLAGEILRTKTIVPVQGMVINEEIRIMLATQAAIMTFGLPTPKDSLHLDWLRNWNQVIVYPTPFFNGRENLLSVDGFLVSWAGVESGETSYQGEIVINWQDDQPHPLRANPTQVFMHEIAHKLDMLDGHINGHPPLHAHMSEKAWFEAFENAYEHLNLQLDLGKKTTINPYAANRPAEFFAVTTEYFFEAPQVLKSAYPKVYEQLALFYRQNPLTKTNRHSISRSIKNT